MKNTHHMINMIIPCEDCLVYPACKHKRRINCTELHSWVWNGYYFYDKLPNLCYVGFSNGTSTVIIAGTKK